MLFRFITVSVLLSIVSGSQLPPRSFYDVRVFDADLHESVLDLELCRQHLEEMEAFEFFDASFRVPHGILTGNTRHYGNFHQCLAIDQEITPTNHIRGKHCMIDVQDVAVSLPELPGIPWPGLARDEAQNVTRHIADVMRKLKEYVGSKSAGMERTALGLPIPSLILGVCIPASCTPEQALDSMFDGEFVSVQYSPALCRLPGDKPLVAADYIAIVIFSLIGLLTFFSTVYDINHTIILKRDPKQLNQLYACGSVYSNARRLFTFTSAPGNLTCLDGIRSFSILWIIFGHGIQHTNTAGLQNQLELLGWFNSPAAALWQATNVTVDSFLMMSGLLLIYTSANKLTQAGLLKNLHMFYLNRLLRMFPMLATAVLVQASVAHHSGDGARWDWQGYSVEDCRRFWWAALLHIQNYYNIGQACLPHSWYLSVDTQLHIVSPVVLFWALGGRRSGWVGVPLTLLLSLAASTAYVFLVVDQPGALYYYHYHQNTLTRAPVFFVGALFGYILHVRRNNKLVLSAWQVAAIWTVSLSLLSSSAYTFYAASQSLGPDPRLFGNLYDCFSRSVWATGLGLLIVASVHGYGGPINWLLSLTVCKFLARISFAMYLFHYIIQFTWASSTVSPFYFSLPNAWQRFMSDAVMTVAVSTAVTVLIDMPFAALQKRFIGGGMRKPVPSKRLVDEDTKPTASSH